MSHIPESPSHERAPLPPIEYIESQCPKCSEFNSIARHFADDEFIECQYCDNTYSAHEGVLEQDRAILETLD